MTAIGLVKAIIELPMNKDPLWQILHRLPTDYSDYGGEVKRWEDSNLSYPDCSTCLYFRRLASLDMNRHTDDDWGVCTNLQSPRRGLLTWEHQAGVGCWAQ